MKKLLFLLLFTHSFLTKGQCDLEILNFNPILGEITVAFNSTENCGGDGGPDGISELQFGFQAVDEDCNAMNVGWDFPSGFSLNPNSSHPGWIYSATTTESPTNWTNLYDESLDPPYYAGDIVTFPLWNPYQADCVDGPAANQMYCNLEGVITYWYTEGYSIQAVIWQISYGPTMYAADGGWAEIGPNGDGTAWGSGLYEDENFENNWFITGPCTEADLSPDAVVSNVEFNVGCIGDVPAYNLDYTIYNYGNDTITDYCIEIWNEDYYQCYNSDLFNGGFGNYAIPPGEGQAFSTPFFEFTGNPGGFFTISVDSVNDEIITGNNNTTIYYPDNWPECPVTADTVFIPTPADTVFTYIYQVDTILTYIETIDSVFIQLPTDTIYDTTYVIEFMYDTTYIVETEFIYDTTYIETQLPPDTIILTEIEYLTDTLYIDNYIYEYDTIYIDVPIIDTLYITETEIIYDTTFVTEYIFLTDTITEYIVQEIWIDCETGLPCGEELPGIECSDWTSIYAANTFTPNNDGINDTWVLKYDLNCWENVEFKIFNRWGDIIYQASGDSFDGYPYWNGSVDDGDHYAADGIYVFLFTAKKIGKAEVIKEQGHVTIFR
jgi:gliding motility-associated-like protein